jgi:hypothetical protein
MTLVAWQVEASLYAVLQRNTYLGTKSRTGVLCVFLYGLPTFCSKLLFSHADGPDLSFEEVGPCR